MTAEAAERRCLSMDPETFFPGWGDNDSARRAKWACNGTPRVVDGHVMGPSSTEPCPAREECLATALRLEAGKHPCDRWGIWGGLTPTQRAHLDETRHKPRPPIDPRPSRGESGRGWGASRPVADHCTWPGRAQGAARHRALEQDLCPPCRENEIKTKARRLRDQHVASLDAAGLTIGQIALAVGERRDTVRGILARNQQSA